MSLVQNLALISQKPNTTPRDALTIARRVCRLLCEVREAIGRERRAMRRQAAKLRQFEPFTRQAADDIERQAGEHHTTGRPQACPDSAGVCTVPAW